MNADIVIYGIMKYRILQSLYNTRWADLGVEAREVKVTIFHIKLVHTIIFWILSACTVYALYSGIADRSTTWTWVAVLLLLGESVVLVLSGWTCPLTILAERQGALTSLPVGVEVSR